MKSSLLGGIVDGPLQGKIVQPSPVVFGNLNVPPIGHPSATFSLT